LQSLAKFAVTLEIATKACFDYDRSCRTGFLPLRLGTPYSVSQITEALQPGHPESGTGFNGQITSSKWRQCLSNASAQGQYEYQTQPPWNGNLKLLSAARDSGIGSTNSMEWINTYDS
jgi:hypothetical protein